jgi:oleandomycin transport system ATP-binding protein
MIEVDGLVKRFGRTTALDGVTLDIPAGTVCGLLGPNGAGKTTLVRILATLLRADAGTARIGGHDVRREPQRVRELIGLTGQFAAVDEALTGAENLRLIARLLEMPRRTAKSRAHEVLERFGLGDAGGRLVRTYSGGMRRRLDVAASLLGSPKVLFLDEPTTGLDPRSRADVWDLVRGLVADGTTVLLTTQYLEEADRLATAVSVIDHGRVVVTGTPSQLKSRVGGQTLSVRPTDPAQSARAAEVLGGQDDDGLVTVPLPPQGSTAIALAEAAAELERAGVGVDEIGIRLASLDEVFMKLTAQEVAA